MMDISKVIKLRPGHYVVAVSGGVDSMALMHLLAKKHHQRSSGLKFTVAHFDHGIRDDSRQDRLLVCDTAKELKLPFAYEEGHLGSDVSEETARNARYEFLKKIQSTCGARGIVTAHHHDDVVETAILNLLRGTGRKGLSPIRSRDGLHRPLLSVPKSRLKSYAKANGLKWHEDSTNTDQKYRRNFVRHSVIAKAKQKSPRDYQKLITLLRRQRELNQAIDQHLETMLHVQPRRTSLRRSDVVLLSYRSATELVAEWLRQNGKRGFNRWLIDRVTVAIRTAQPHTEFLLDSGSKVIFSKHTVEFERITQ